ncbi:MAG TPA: DotI/IcmL/TraM family protein [Alphaproteobacteria bacterium]|nr:DotI/IcmL/TraM family protein [Alphaproteobacteria bacterium]
MNQRDAIQTVMSRNSFYRDGYRALLRVALVQGLIIAALVTLIVVLVLSSNVRHVFFATNVDGRIMPISAVSEPYFPDDQVITWTAKTAREVMQMDYLNYRTHLDEVNTRFTPTGRVDFQNALKESRLLEAIEEKKLVTQLKIEGAPQILKEGMSKNGVYSWYLSMPVSIIYDGQDAPQPLRGALQVRVDRVNFLEIPQGIAFGQWIIGQDANYRPGVR